MENKMNEKGRQENRVFGGLILIVVGAALLLRNAGFPLPYWLFSWPVILILVCVYSGVKHKFANNTWIILVAIGSFFLFFGLPKAYAMHKKTQNYGNDDFFHFGLFGLFATYYNNWLRFKFTGTSAKMCGLFWLNACNSV